MSKQSADDQRIDRRIDHQPSISPEAYFEELRGLVDKARASQTLPVERLPLLEARGRVLAEDIRSLVDIPGFANSAMDGYAVRSADLGSLPVTLRLVGVQPAGPRQDLSVGAGEAVAIMTGAPLPAGADAVIQSELTEERDGEVVISAEAGQSGPRTFSDGSALAGMNIRAAGEDCRRGDLVLSAGTALGPRQLSAAASSGYAELPVVRPLRVAIISTGDELAPTGTELLPGQIYESNSVLLAALAEAAGAQVVSVSSVDDEGQEMAAALDTLTGAALGGSADVPADTTADVILMSGGVSVGRFDVARNVLGAAPDARFVRVAIQPGKPQGHALWHGVPVIAFPGNPVGAFVSFTMFGAPFLHALAGGTFALPKTVAVRAGDSWKCPKGRRQFVPVRILEPSDLDEGVADLSPLTTVIPLLEKGSRSHLVTRLALAEALAVVPAEVDRVEVGDEIQMMEIQ